MNLTCDTVKRSQNDIAKREITVITESEKKLEVGDESGTVPREEAGRVTRCLISLAFLLVLVFRRAVTPTLCDPMDCACRPLCPWDCLGVDGRFHWL